MCLDSSLVYGRRRTKSEPLSFALSRDALVIVSLAWCAAVSIYLIDVATYFFLVADHAGFDSSTRSLLLVAWRGHLHTR